MDIPDTQYRGYLVQASSLLNLPQLKSIIIYAYHHEL